jgi:hypothetical protein
MSPTGGEVQVGGNPPVKPKTSQKDPCATLKALGVTNADLGRMKQDYFNMVDYNSNPANTMREFGHARIGGNYYDYSPSGRLYRMQPSSNGRLFNLGLNVPDLPNGTGYSFHTHHYSGPIYNLGGSFVGTANIDGISNADKSSAFSSPSVNFMGNSNGLYSYGKNGNPFTIAGSNWMNLDCK